MPKLTKGNSVFKDFYAKLSPKEKKEYWAKRKQKRAADLLLKQVIQENAVEVTALLLQKSLELLSNSPTANELKIVSELWLGKDNPSIDISSELPNIQVSFKK